MARKAVHDEIEAGYIRKVVFISSQEPAGVLQRLTCEPEVLNAVAMLPARHPNLRGKAAENGPRRAVNREKRLVFEPPEGGQPLLPIPRIGSDLRAEP